MPSLWWLPLRGADPAETRLDHLHAAVSRWFDPDLAAHNAQIKPYAVSPAARTAAGGVGIEIATLTDGADACLRAAAAVPRQIRLGSRAVQTQVVRRMRTQPWSELAQPSGAAAWSVRFETPTTFRSGSRSAPWPAPAAVLHGLADVWETFADVALSRASHREIDSVWVAEIDGHSEVVPVAQVRMSGFVGQIDYRCSDRSVAALVDPLFRLAPYSGVGSAKGRGLGRVRLVERSSPALRVG